MPAAMWVKERISELVLVLFQAMISRLGGMSASGTAVRPSGLLQQQAGLIVERGPSTGERDRGGRTVQQHSVKIDLQLLDRPAQRRLGHVQPCGRAAEVPFLGNGHEVAQGA